MQLAPIPTQVPPPVFTDILAVSQLIDTRTTMDPARGSVATTTSREFRLNGLVDGRRYASFEDALESARLVTAGRALGAAIVRESDGKYELHRVNVYDITVESWLDPTSGAEQRSYQTVHKHRFTESDIIAGTPARVENDILAGVVRGAWAMRSVRDASRGVELLKPVA